MSETKTLHRNFWVWEFEKEERWLNEMAQEGWALQNAGFCTYTFERMRMHCRMPTDIIFRTTVF